MSYNELDDYIDDNILNQAMVDYIKKIKEIENSNEKPPEPTELKVSTRSSKAEISAYINMINLINFLVKKINEDTEKKGLLEGVKMKKFIYSRLPKHLKMIMKKKKKKKKDVGKNYYLCPFFYCVYIDKDNNFKRVVYDDSKSKFFYNLELDLDMAEKYSDNELLNGNFKTYVDNEKLKNVFKDCELYDNNQDDILLRKFMEYKRADWAYIEKGLSLLTNNKREHFYNSCTIIIKPDKERRPVNVKLFANGQITITGGLENKDGQDAVISLLKIINVDKNNFLDNNKLDEATMLRFTKNKKCGEKINGYIKPKDTEIIKYDITMINSDYKLNFNVDRDKLYNILMNETGLMSVFDGNMYPGVKIYYYWNLFNKENNGICKCTNKIKCKGKGNGLGEHKCKKITVVIFQSGSVMITGANSDYQIEHVHKDIKKIIEKYYTRIIKFSIKDHLIPDDDDVPPDESYIEEMNLNNNKKKEIKIKKCENTKEYF